MESTRDDNLDVLTQMGFPLAQARRALEVTGGIVDSAINYLLGSVSLGASSSFSSASRSFDTQQANYDMVHCAISQYDISSSNSGQPVGRSACSCIALEGASLFLSALNNRGNIKDVIVPESLQQCILNGIELYGTCRQLRGGGIEHFSPEEVLELSSILGEKLVLIGGMVRQGILSNNYSDVNENGLHEQLLACRNGTIDSKWIAVVMTKTPETVLLLLPPKDSNQPYVLVDSHPRPTPFNAPGSYALLCYSQEAMEQALKQIFPATELDSSVGEMASMMYNSFDLYSFQLK